MSGILTGSVFSAAGGVWVLKSNTGSGGTSGTTTTGAIDTTGADLIVAVLVDFNTASPAAAISDSKSNSWTTEADSHVVADTRTRLAWTRPVSVGSGHTFTLANTATFPALCVAAFFNSNATPADQQNGASNGSAASLATGSVTPSVSNELIISGFGFGGSSTPAIDSGFTITDSVAFAVGTHYGASLAYLISGSAQNPTWSLAGTAGVAARIETFKPA